ncbi:MAG: uracil phosphoribosyltransferase [Bacteroidota bacterium]
MIHNLGETNSLINEFISEIRDVNIQTDSMRFRKNIERLGQIFAYEVSKKLEYQRKEVTTLLGVADMKVLAKQPVLSSILRAGLPFHQGFLDFFDRSDNAFVSAYRRHHKSGKFDIQIEYVSCPPLQDRTLILVDPMLATGNSLVLSLRQLLTYGAPLHIHIVSIIASIHGIEYVKRNLTGTKYTLWTGAIDDELTAQSYIVPGLGDAGDLAYGSKRIEDIV